MFKSENQIIGKTIRAKGLLVLLALLLPLISVHSKDTLAQQSIPGVSSGASSWVDEEYVSVRLISATQAVGSADRSAPLVFGLEFQLADNWKVYWRSPGDAGYPPSSDWAASSNVATVDMRWPAPVRFSVLGFETLGYKHEIVYPLYVTPEKHGETLRLAGDVDFLACAEICIPVLASLSLELPPGDAEPSSFAHLINKYDVRVPGDGSAHGLSLDTLVSYPKGSGNNPVLGITATSVTGLPFKSPDIFMEGPDGLAYSQPVVSISEDGLRADLSVEVYNSETLPLIGAAFTATISDGERFAERSMTAEPGSGPPPLATSEDGYSLLSILAVAFLGGLILNLMPCVLPVLSIKLLGVISHGGSSISTVRISFLASAAGIITSFLIIAGALAVLKSAGTAIGWGIQFQHPWFLISMALIIIVFACNLMGWLEFNLPGKLNDAAITGSHGSGIRGHFSTGMLATLLATPCSAPFLGTAVGFALSRGTYEIMVIFFVLGLGLATPYLIVAITPKLATSLPKPGAWMITLRRILGVALAGTALWLLSVLTVQVGWLGTALVGGFIFGIAVILFIGNRYEGMPRKIIAPAVLALAILALGTPMFTEKSGRAEAKPIDALWQPFDQAAISAHVNDGRVVFVDVTADWCITCQVNKSFVLGVDPVFSELSANNVIAMQADWTLPNDEISHYLASFQRYGIPFNAVYGPAAPQGITLPELLSQDAVQKAIRDARG